jgi:nucleoside-diphosphate-sugar epimerase
MLILVTGAAGYVGAPAVSRLLSAGHAVRALDSLAFGGAALLGAYPSGRFTLVHGDVRDPLAVGRAVAGADAVVHLAGIVGDPACAAQPRLAREVNVDATAMLHRAARQAGVSRFIFASSCSVYGHSDRACDERATLRPLSLYAETKAEAERGLLGTHGAGLMACTVLRFATLYGLAPRMRFDLVANIFARDAQLRRRVTVHAPAAWRPLVHVADIAAAIGGVLDAPAGRVAGEVFNVASRSANYTLLDIARAAVRASSSGAEIDIRPVAGDARDYQVTGEKLTAVTGWAPARGLDEGKSEITGALEAGVLEPEASHAAA